VTRGVGLLRGIGRRRGATPRRGAAFLRGTAVLAAVAALAATLGSCAYYNTFYYARKYYYRATDGAPYALDGPAQQQLANYNKAIDYSKKVIANYPRSKWVDDAYVLWAVALIGKSDPLETVNMLAGFETRFPKSPLAADARFYLGVAYRRARKYDLALEALDAYLERSPKGRLAPYALLERSRALVSLERPGEAADAAGQILARFPKHPLATPSRAARAEARFAARAYVEAREDYRFMGSNARDDQQRFDFLLREAECLEAARRYDEALALLEDAISYELEPRLPDTTGGRPLVAPSGPVAERWGRLMTRAGTVLLLSGDLERALGNYQRVIDRYPRSGLAAEAQYRIGYAYETAADDFERAREAYGRVREQAVSSAFSTQAASRLSNLDRIAQYAQAGGDSVERQAEIGFLLAEQYLFQLEKPERALAEYEQLARRFDGTPYGAKALNAQAWVLRRKLGREAAADSLWWHVVRNHPATEAQLAARDYLELQGESVPPDLIRFPEQRNLAIADTVEVPQAPAEGLFPLGFPTAGRFAPGDSTGPGPRGVGLPGMGPPATRALAGAPGDTTAAANRGAAGRAAAGAAPRGEGGGDGGPAVGPPSGRSGGPPGPGPSSGAGSPAPRDTAGIGRAPGSPSAPPGTGPSPAPAPGSGVGGPAPARDTTGAAPRPGIAPADTTHNRR
jgi:tetratricopeptide (TPR) repeat protein